MRVTVGDVQRIHGSFGGVQELLDRRRAIYRLSVELADDGVHGAVLSDDVLDNPTVRAHLGDVLGGTSAYDRSRMSSLSRFVDTSGRIEAAGCQVHLASTPSAGFDLEEALRHINDALARSTSSPLVLEGTQQFADVAGTLADGIELAVAVAPDLALDLLPHVALFAVVDVRFSGRLGSASVREFPGLIVLPEPKSPLEVAEALIHEGAHQKYFDLAMTRSVLGPATWLRYSPPWRPVEGPGWPFEQCVAAFHAYCCLAAFHRALCDGPEIALHHGSLLPCAAERAQILGSWLLDHGNYLGPDGQQLIAQFTGFEFDTAPASTGIDESMSELRASLEPVGAHRCGDWTLIMRLASPAVLVWAPSDTVESDVLAGRL